MIESTSKVLLGALLPFLLIAFILVPSASNGQSPQIVKVDKHLAKGDTSKAMKKLNRFIEKADKQPDLYLYRAQLKMNRGDLEPAMVDLNTFCSLNKVCGEADLFKGIIRFKQGDYNGAIAFLSIYASKHNDERAWHYLAQSHMWLQNYPVAINAFKRAIKSSPEDVASIYNAGLCAYYAEQYELSDSLFAEGEKLSPDDLDIRLGRGLALLRKGDHINSNKLFRTFEVGEKHYSKALYNIGVNYYHLNEKDLACQYWSNAIKLGHLQAEEARQRHCGKKK